MNGKLIVRQTPSFRGQSIDPLISDDAIEFLYDNWQPNWPEILVLSGGLKDITCEMVVDVPDEELRKQAGRSKKKLALVDEIVKVAKEYAS